MQKNKKKKILKLYKFYEFTYITKYIASDNLFNIVEERSTRLAGVRT